MKFILNRHSYPEYISQAELYFEENNGINYIIEIVPAVDFSLTIINKVSEFLKNIKHTLQFTINPTFVLEISPVESSYIQSLKLLDFLDQVEIIITGVSKEIGKTYSEKILSLQEEN